MAPSSNGKYSSLPMRYRHGKQLDDADIAAGTTSDAQRSVPSGILRHRSGENVGTANNPVGTSNNNTDEFEEFADNFSREVEKYGSKIITEEDNIHSERLIVLGIDISHCSRRSRFFICASGVYGFSLIYGFLQELLSVQILNRKLGLFLAVSQFVGYTCWSYVFRRYDQSTKANFTASSSSGTKTTFPTSNSNNKESGFYNKPGVVAASLTPSSSFLSLSDLNAPVESYRKDPAKDANIGIPLHMYIGLSILRAIDLGMTNLSMQYMNYPAKTMMKSSRVVFTMLFGVVISRRKYPIHDYIVVTLMVTGLALFLHADSTSSAVFQSMGVVMLATSLMCDGAITNMSESLMKKHNVGQDEYIFRLYSVATLAISIAAAYTGDIKEGVSFMLNPGSYEEIMVGTGALSTWTSWKKIAILILFSTTGFLGSSCSACITREYGALTMSITSTARKATTLFLSFAFFKNVCTWEHILGIIIFISSLVFKSLGKGPKSNNKWRKTKTSAPSSANYELTSSFV